MSGPARTDMMDAGCVAIRARAIRNTRAPLRPAAQRAELVDTPGSDDMADN